MDANRVALAANFPGLIDQVKAAIIGAAVAAFIIADAAAKTAA